MLKFNYIAREPGTGKRVKATVQAENEQAAAGLIRKEGQVPISITLANGAGGSLFNRLNRVTVKDRVLFSRQLATLINAGLPLVQSLRSVAEQTEKKPLKVIINDIIADVEGGAALSVSMAKHPKVFNAVYVSLIAAGESSGTLDTALDRIAIQQEKDADIISKIRGAMIYPAIVMLVMIAVVTFMIVKVMPQVQILYTSFPGANLPIETRLLLDLSHIITKYWWVVLLVLAILAFIVSKWARTLGGKKVIDALKVKMPPIGGLFMKVYMARFSRTASTLAGAGVPLLQVLQITGEAVNNYYVQNSVDKAAEKVKGGKSLSESLQGDPYFLPLVPNMLGIGEKSGSLETMLAKTADYYEKEVDDAVANLSSILEPVMMVILGIMALIIVAAVLLPVYGLAGSGAISSGGV